MKITRKNISLFHILVVVPVLLGVGYRAVNKKKVTVSEGYVMLLLGTLALISHLRRLSK